MMAKHLFFTGEKRVGKSTLINNLLKKHPCQLGGFRTVRTKEFYGTHFAIHLLKPIGDAPSAENLLFLCDRPRDEHSWERFDQLGCAALENSNETDLILMDELGPNEANAQKFQSAVLAALEGDTPILGVLQKADSPFLEKIANHPNVTVIEVTKENRDELTSIELFQK